MMTGFGGKRIVIISLFAAMVWGGVCLGQMIVSGGNDVNTAALKALQPAEKMLDYTVVSKDEMDKWPVDKAGKDRSSSDDKSGRYYEWSIWPNRVVFEVDSNAAVVSGTAAWRRSVLSIRQKGLKLISAKTNEIVNDAWLGGYEQDKVQVYFRPVSGAGLYYLYYGAFGAPLFNPSTAWLDEVKKTKEPKKAAARRIEARCKLDSFYPMETVPLKAELADFRKMYVGARYLVFPQDRDNSIKMPYEIPASWVFRNPKDEFVIEADRNEYRVFQIGIWACSRKVEDVTLKFSDFKTVDSNAVIGADKLMCLTLESKIKSIYIQKPASSMDVPENQVRALWVGVDLAENVKPGLYKGAVTVNTKGDFKVVVPVSIKVSDKVVAARGDNDLWRLSRLRWLESDYGLSDEFFPPFTALKLDKEKWQISTWGHKLELNEMGLPKGLSFGDEQILAKPIKLGGKCDGNDIKWMEKKLEFTEATDGHVCWIGKAKSTTGLELTVDGRIDFDGCIIITLKLDSQNLKNINGLMLAVGWKKECAELACGMGYSGRRETDRIWNDLGREHGAHVWLGSVKAGMGWTTTDVGSWKASKGIDALEFTQKPEGVIMQANFGEHEVVAGKAWQIQFALRPTPVKPVDKNHWQYRYYHVGGDTVPYHDTPEFFLKDNCKQLDEVAALGAKRFNLHDWWGPAFNNAWQWDGPNNLTALVKEAHKRGIYVKAYNSGREISNIAAEFWPIVYEGSGYQIPEKIDPNYRGRYQDAWMESHMPDRMPIGWPRVHEMGNEHSVPVSNGTRNGNFYIESMKYMAENFGVDGAYFDGADGSSLGHREMCKRLWTVFRKTNPNALIDAHHGTAGIESPIASVMICLPYIDSVWLGETYDYEQMNPWQWLVEVSGIPFGIPSEMLGQEQYYDRGMLFGIWPRMAWCAGTKIQKKLWDFFDTFEIQNAKMNGFWEKDNGVLLDRHDVYTTTFVNKPKGVLLVMASWHQELAPWENMRLNVSVRLNRQKLELPAGELTATDIMSGEQIDLDKPIKLMKEKDSRVFKGRLIWIKGKESKEQGKK